VQSDGSIGVLVRNNAEPWRHALAKFKLYHWISNSIVVSINRGCAGADGGGEREDAR
jgi:hypothetical protein